MAEPAQDAQTGGQDHVDQLHGHIPKPPRGNWVTKFDYLYESELMPIRVEEGSATVVAAGNLSLPSDLEPGEYWLLVVIYDLSVVSKKAIERDDVVHRLSRKSPELQRLTADAYITVAPAGGPAPERVQIRWVTCGRCSTSTLRGYRSVLESRGRKREPCRFDRPASGPRFPTRSPVPHLRSTTD